MTDTANYLENATEGGVTFRELFDGLGVSVWIQDASAAKERLEALRASGVRDFVGYFAQNPQAIDELRATLRTVDFNEESLRLFGAETREDLLNNNGVITTEHTGDLFRQAFIALGERRQTMRCETVLQTLQGRRFACLLSLDAGPPERNCRRVIVTMTDISEQKDAEVASAALAAAGLELSASLDYEETLTNVARALVPDFADWCAVDLLDKDGDLRRLAVAHVDPSKVAFAEELHKRYPPDPASERGVWQVIRSGRPEMMSEIPQELIELTAVDKEHLRIINELKLRSYICVPLSAREKEFGAISLVKSDSSRPYTEADLIIAREIAARASAAIDNAWLHQEVQESEQRLRDAVSALPAAMYTTDTEGRITLYNEAAVTLWGREPALGEQWCGSWRIYMPDGSPLPLDQCPMALTLREGRSTRYEILVERPDGSRVPVMPYPQPLFNSAGELTGAINMLVDLTESKRTEEALQRQLRQLEVIYRLSSAVGGAADADAISEAALDGLVDATGADRASVLLYDDDGVMRFKGWRNLSEGYRAAVEGHSPWQPSDTGAVPITSNDVTTDENLAELLDTITSEGIRSLAFIPLLASKRLLGKFMVYYDEPHEFTPEEVQLCQTIAGHVSHAIERSRSETALVESEERYRTVFHSIDQGFCLCEMLIDEDGKPYDYRFLEVNPVFEKHTGLKDAAGKTALEMLPDLEPEWIERYGRVALTGEPASFTLGSDVMGRWFDVHALRMGPAESHRFAIIFTDVTERRGWEKNLRESEERYRAVVESQSGMLCRFRPDGEILFANGAYAEAFGTTAEELAGRNFWDFISEEDRESVRVMLNGLTPDQPEIAIENRVQTVEGERWTLWTNRALAFENGRVTEAQSSGIDITARKRAEEALRQSEERFRGVVEAAPNGIILVDRQGRIVMANPEAERSLGYAPGELDQQPVEVLVPERLREDHTSWRDAFLNSPDTRPMGAGRDLFARRKDGSEFPVEIGLSPLDTPQGPRILATIVDITERKRAEEDMRAAAALKDQFLGLVSHELRTPIATVSGNSKLLLRRSEHLSAEDRQQALEDIASEAGRLQAIIENLLILSRIDGASALHFEPVALDKLASNRIEAFTRRSPARPIDFSATGNSMVEGEANLLAMVLDNLIANADKYSPRGAPIELSLRNGGGDVEMKIRDHGIGLDEGEVPNLFEPFYRGTLGRDLAKGMGLGLATCKRIIEAHNGRIWATHIPDGGSEFTFVLPVIKEPIAEEEIAGPS